MKVFRVDEIVFQFNYQFNNYFKNNIEKYEVFNQTPNNVINVTIVDEIVLPMESNKNISEPKEIITENNRIIYYENKKGILVEISHDHEYKNIDIKLNKKIINDLARAEYIYSGIMFLELALYYNYLPLHGTAIYDNNCLFIISAPSQTGKSTLRKYWQESFPNALIINDDKPILKIEGNNIYVLGSPFSGEDILNENIKEKLNTIIFLEQGVENEIVQLTKTEQIALLVKNIYKPKYDHHWDVATNQIEKIINNIFVFGYKAKNDISAAKLLSEKIKCLK